MTERRPHWDDQLVYAVIHEIGVLRPSPHSLRDTAYAVISAVEDWIDARGSAIDGREVVAAIAAVARVREASDGNQPIPAPNTDNHDAASYAAGYVDAMRHVRQALEGDSHD